MTRPTTEPTTEAGGPVPPPPSPRRRPLGRMRWPVIGLAVLAGAAILAWQAGTGLIGWAGHRVLAGAGFPEARFAITGVGLGHLTLGDVITHPSGPRADSVDARFSLASLWAGHVQTVHVRGLRAVLRIEASGATSIDGLPWPGASTAESETSATILPLERLILEDAVLTAIAPVGEAAVAVDGVLDATRTGDLSGPVTLAFEGSLLSGAAEAQMALPADGAPRVELALRDVALAFGPVTLTGLSGYAAGEIGPAPSLVAELAARQLAAGRFRGDATTVSLSVTPERLEIDGRIQTADADLSLGVSAERQDGEGPHPMALQLGGSRFGALLGLPAPWQDLSGMIRAELALRLPEWGPGFATALLPEGLLDRGPAGSIAGLRERLESGSLTVDLAHAARPAGADAGPSVLQLAGTLDRTADGLRLTLQPGGHASLPPAAVTVARPLTLDLGPPAAGSPSPESEVAAALAGVLRLELPDLPTLALDLDGSLVLDPAALTARQVSLRLALAEPLALAATQFHTAVLAFDGPVLGAGAAEGRATLALALDRPEIETLQAEIGGALQWNGTMLGLALDPCSRLTAERLRPATASPAAGPFEFCLEPAATDPGSGPPAANPSGVPPVAFTPETGALAVALRLRPVRTAPLTLAPDLVLAGEWPSLDLAFEQAADAEPRVTLRLAGGRPVIGPVTLDQTTLTAALRWTDAGPIGPIALRGTLAIPGLLPATPLRVDLAADGAQARLDGRAELAGARAILTATGQVRTDLSGGRVALALPLAFAPGGLQPVAFSPAVGQALAELPLQMSGAARISADLAWNASGGLTQSGQLVLDGLSATLDPLRIDGMQGTIALNSLWPPRSPPAQRLTAERVQAATAMGPLEMTFQVLGVQDADISSASLGFAGGQLEAGGLKVRDGAVAEAFTVGARRLDLAELSPLLALDGFAATGRVGGLLPIRPEAEGLAVRGGVLETEAPGVLRYQPDETASTLRASGDQMGLLLDVLEDFRYTRVRLTLDGVLHERMDIGLALLGRNPGVQEGRPVDLNVTLDSAPLQLVDAAIRNIWIGSDLGQRLVDRMEQRLR